MDFYDFERTRIIKNYSNIDRIEDTLNILSKRFHIYNMNAISYELFTVNKIKKYKIKSKDLKEKLTQISDEMRSAVSSLIISNMRIYTFRNQGIHIVSIDNYKVFKVKKENDLKSEKKIASLKKIYKSKGVEIDNLFLFNIYLKFEVNKLIVNFYKKREKFLSKKIDIVIKKEQSNIKKIEVKMNVITRKLDRNRNNLKKIENEIFKLKEYMKLEIKKNTKKTNYLYVEIKSISNKFYNIKKRHKEEIEKINFDYRETFNKNKLEEMCPICLEEDKRYITTSCGHNFHVECICIHIDNILLKNNIEITCPMCRQIMI
jgi:hypothetical protein